jgi:hypothetical protein
VSAEISALTLAREPLYGLAATAGVILASLALLGYRLDLRARFWAPASIPYHFLSMNLALLLGLIAFLRGTQSTVWTPTARFASMPSRGSFTRSITHAAADVRSEQRVASGAVTRAMETL